MNPTSSRGPLAAGPPESPLLPEHRAAGATLTSFAGWTMPLRYGSDLAEHRAVREAGGLFDLSHMAQLEVAGPGAAAALDRSVVSVVSGLSTGRARYTMLTAADGGILDDLIVYRLSDEEFLVIANAANRLTVLDALAARSEGLEAVVVDRTPHRALIALQGPVAAGVLGALASVDLGTLRYYAIAVGAVAGTPALVARTGYTGEDGFELSVPASAAVAVWRALRDAGAQAGVVPCGLASRDTLRLEAGMPLYGHELTADITPYDAGLGRVVDLGHEFVGRDALAVRSALPGGQTLVGLMGSGRRAARAGHAVLLDEVQIGTVTSGALSPTLGHPVALAHVTGAAAEPGTEVLVDVRGARQPMRVVPLPFYRRSR
jgi:aminomethyltransferase